MPGWIERADDSGEAGTVTQLGGKLEAEQRACRMDSDIEGVDSGGFLPGSLWLWLVEDGPLVLAEPCALPGRKSQEEMLKSKGMEMKPFSHPGDQQMLESRPVLTGRESLEDALLNNLLTPFRNRHQ